MTDLIIEWGNVTYGYRNTFDWYHGWIQGFVPLSGANAHVVKHPFRPLTFESENSGINPFSPYPPHDCYQEQVSGRLRYELEQTIPLKPGVAYTYVYPTKVGTYYAHYVYPGGGYTDITIKILHDLYFEEDDRGQRSYYLWAEREQYVRTPNGSVVFSQNTTLNLMDRPEGEFIGVDSGTNFDCQAPPISDWDIATNARELEALEKTLDSIPEFDWGQLCYKAVESIRSLDINGLAYLHDTVELAKTARALAKGDITALSDLTGPVKGILKKGSWTRKAKSAASTYLGHHYGTKLFLRDTEEISAFLSEFEDPYYGSNRAFWDMSWKQAYQRCFAQHTESLASHPIHGADTVSVRRSVSAVVRSFSDNLLHEVDSIREASNQLVSRIRRAGYELDVIPSAANLWDLVPYSFVIDWFLPIGERLNQLENRNYMRTLPVMCVSYSTIIEYNARIPASGWSSNDMAHHKIYKRHCSDSLVIPSRFLESQGSSQWQHHVIEGGALLTNLIV